MNDSLALPAGGHWPVAPYDSPATATGQRTYASTNILDFATLISIIQHWRWLVLGAAAAGFVGATVITLLITPTYRAWVTLEANPPTFSVSADQSPERNGGKAESYDFVATQIGLLSSRSVAERTAQELSLANNPAIVPQDVDASRRLKIATVAVSQGLKVIPPQQGQLIRFSYDSASPQLAASIANGVADSFIKSALQRRYEASAYARNFLQRQIAKTRGDLERSERALVAYAQQQGIIDTAGADGNSSGGDTGSLQGESLVALNKALADATARRMAAEGAYREALATGPTSDVTQSTQPLRQQQAALEAEYQQKRTFMKPQHPEMLSLRSRIDELQKQVERETAQISSGRNNSLLTEYRAAASAEGALRAQVASLKGDVLDLRGRSIQYNILQRDVDTNRSLYDALLQRYKEIGVAGGVGTAPVSIVDRADVPSLPYRPNLFLNLLFGLGAGLLAGVAGAVGLEFMTDTIKTREDVRKKLSLPCLGAVPRTAARDAFVKDLRNPASAVSEAYSAIVAALMFSTEAGMPNVLLITSANSAEGKSSTALALAQSFSRREKSVLLMDADLRKPSFRAGTDKLGLSRLLTSQDHLRSHVIETSHANLWLLPSGLVPPNPADLLSTGRIRKIIAEAREQFDLVLIDGPPTLGLADAPLLSSTAENVIFVVESGSTRTKAAIEALNRLEATGAHVLGAALTKSSGEPGYRYSRYGYGFKYGREIDKDRSEILMIPQGAES